MKKSLIYIIMLVLISFMANALVIDNCISDNKTITSVNRLSCNVTLDQDINYYFTINGENYQVMESGELITNFNSPDFYRGWISSIINTELDENYSQTIEYNDTSIIVDSEDVTYYDDNYYTSITPSLTKCGIEDCMNFSYQFTNEEKSEYFGIHFQIDRPGEGIDFLNNNYYGITTSIKALEDSNLKMRMKLFGYNTMNMSDGVSCGSRYYEIKPDSEFHEITIPFSDFIYNENETIGCFVNMRNITRVFLYFNDINDSEITVNNFFLKDMKYAKSYKYVLDDFDYLYNQSLTYYEESDYSRWYEPYTRKDPKTNDLDLISSYENSNSKYNDTYGASLEVGVEIDSTANDYITLRKRLPYLLNLSNFDRFGFYYKQSPNITSDPFDSQYNSTYCNIYANSKSFNATNSMKLKVYFYGVGDDFNSSTACGIDYINLVNQSWTNLEWKLSTFTSTCNISNINHIDIQFNDVNNVVGFGEAPCRITTYLDDFYFIKNNTEVELSYDYMDEDILSNQSINWTLNIIGNVNNLSSSVNNFHFLNDYNLSELDIENINEDLITWWVNNIDLNQRYDFSFIESNYMDRFYFENSIKSIKNNSLSLAKSYANAIDYKIINFTDNITNDQFYILTSQNQTLNKGWGNYIYNPNYLNNLSLITPHPVGDYNTTQINLLAFRNVKAQENFIASSHRSDSFNYKAEANELFNIFHPLSNAFINSVQRQNNFLETHGFYEHLHPVPYPDVVISQGTGLVSDMMNIYKTYIEQSFNNDVDVYIFDATPCNLVFNTTYCLNTLGFEYSSTPYANDLKNRYSRFGFLSRENNMNWVMMETSERMRSTEENWIKYSNGISTFYDIRPPTFSNFLFQTNDVYTNQPITMSIEVEDDLIGVNNVNASITFEDGNSFIVEFLNMGTEWVSVFSPTFGTGNYNITNIFSSDLNENIGSYVFNKFFVVRSQDTSGDSSGGGGGTTTPPPVVEDDMEDFPTIIDDIPKKDKDIFNQPTVPVTPVTPTIPQQINSAVSPSESVVIKVINGTLQITPSFLDVLNLNVDFSQDVRLFSKEIKTNMIITECKATDDFNCQIEENRVILTKDYTQSNRLFFNDEAELKIFSNKIVGELAVNVRNVNLASYIEVNPIKTDLFIPLFTKNVGDYIVGFFYIPISIILLVFMFFWLRK